MSLCMSLSHTSGKVRVIASADTPSTLRANAQFLALHFGNVKVIFRTLPAELHNLSPGCSPTQKHQRSSHHCCKDSDGLVLPPDPPPSPTRE